MRQRLFISGAAMAIATALGMLVSAADVPSAAERSESPERPASERPLFSFPRESPAGD